MREGLILTVVVPNVGWPETTLVSLGHVVTDTGLESRGQGAAVLIGILVLLVGRKGISREAQSWPPQSLSDFG